MKLIDINNNKCCFNIKKERNVFPKELILNMESLNNKISAHPACENEIQSLNIFIEPKYNDSKKKNKKSRYINLKYSANTLPINNVVTRNSLLKDKLVNNTIYTSPFITINKIPKIERINNENNRFSIYPSTIKINLKENDFIDINYISDSSTEKKRIKPTFKKSSNISSRKISDNSINNISRYVIDSKRNTSTYCTLKAEDIGKNINNKIINLKYDHYYSNYLFEQINKIRKNPKYFIKYIQSAKKNISIDKNGNSIYKEKLKVALAKGKEAFDEAISSLKEKEPMNPFIFKKELCIDFSTNEKKFSSGDYLKKKIIEKIKKGIKIKAFWRDIINDPKISFLLMIVDDNPIKSGTKRKDILNPKMKYIGINAAYLDSNFVCYIVLSDE